MLTKRTSRQYSLRLFAGGCVTRTWADMRTGSYFRTALAAALALAPLVATVHGIAPPDTLREADRTERPDPPDDAPPRREEHDDCDDDPWDGDDCDDAEEVVGAWALIGLGITSPFWGPPAIIGDTYDRSGYFPTHPYQFNCGYMVI